MVDSAHTCAAAAVDLALSHDNEFGAGRMTAKLRPWHALKR